jgi:transcriptional regulator with XRE-family HTH domain
LYFKRDIFTQFGLYMSHFTVLAHPVQESLLMIGKLIQQARKDAGFTMAALAQRAGIERKTIARLEKGNPSVSIGTFLTVLWLLDVPLLNGLDIGNRQSRKKLSLLLNALSETHSAKTRRQKSNDNF